MRSWQVFAVIALLIAGVAAGGWLLWRNASTAAGVTQTAQAGDLSVTMRVDEQRVGTRTIDVTVSDAGGAPVDVRELRLRFSMLDMDMGTSEALAQPVGAGRFQARGPFFTMVGSWQVEASLLREGQPPLQVPFSLAIAAPGEDAGPANPLKSDALTLQAGQRLYAANCAPCHGITGRGDGPKSAGLSPRPADFVQHMAPGKHTDGQAFLWIRDGFPGTAMPSWKRRLSEEQIWQLVIYLRTFGSTSAPAKPSAVAQPTPTLIPSTQEPLPPLVFARQGSLWRSDGSGAAPRQIASLPGGGYAEYPTFSPDGGSVAFVAITPAPITATLPLPSSALYVMSRDGSGLRVAWKPAQGLLGLPAWAPDGQAIYVAANGAQAGQSTSGRQLQIVRVDLATGAQQPLLSDVLDPAISRDGTQLAFLKLSADGYTTSLMVAAPDGSSPREILGGAQFQGLYAPRFSPDGRRVVVAGVGGPTTDAQGNPVNASAPSALDRLLGLLEPPTAEAHGLPWDLWSINADGTGLRRLASIGEDMPMAAFSPDGKQIAVQAAGGMYLMDGDGGRVRRIDPTGDHGGLDWAR